MKCFCENPVKCFCDNYGLKTIIRKPACSKYSENLICINLMLTNVPSEKRLSDFHLMTLIVTRKGYQKFQSGIIGLESRVKVI